MTLPTKLNGYNLAEFLKVLSPSLVMERFATQQNPYFAKVAAQRLLETGLVRGYVEEKYSGDEGLDEMLEWLLPFKGTGASLEYDEYSGYMLRWWPVRDATEEELEAARKVIAEYKEPESKTVKFKQMVPFTIGYGNFNDNETR